VSRTDCSSKPNGRGRQAQPAKRLSYSIACCGKIVRAYDPQFSRGKSLKLSSRLVAAGSEKSQKK
jgi:hypothetical protein